MPGWIRNDGGSLKENELDNYINIATTTTTTTTTTLIILIIIIIIIIIPYRHSDDVESQMLISVVSLRDSEVEPEPEPGGVRNYR